MQRSLAKKIFLAIALCATMGLGQSCAEFNASNGALGSFLLNSTTAGWFDSSYAYRRKITFGTSHSALPTGTTVTLTMDTTSDAGVALTSGNDVRIVWQPTSGSAVELARIGSTWNGSATTIEFRVQTAISANTDEPSDGTYYVYYGNAAAGTPSTDEMQVYYFADFFGRSDSTTISNGWTEVTDGNGSSDMSIVSGAVSFSGQGDSTNLNMIRQTFSLGALPGNFILSFTMNVPTNDEGTWAFFAQVVNSTAPTSDTDYTTGAGPGLFLCESNSLGAGCNNTYTLTSDLTNQIENSVTGSHNYTLTVDTGAQTIGYDRDSGTATAAGLAYFSAQTNLDQIRIGVTRFGAQAGEEQTVDNLKLILNPDTAPTLSLGGVETL